MRTTKISSHTARTIWRLVATCAIVAATAAHATDETPADGMRLAQKLCSNCHDVRPAPSTDRALPGPSFRAIASRAGQTAVAVAGSIIIPHPAMPNVPLTRAEVRSLVAYISSLHPNGRLPTSSPVMPAPPPKPNRP